MASLSISETQFVFTYFHKLATLQGSSWYDFIFPSLQQEGDPLSKYSGADLIISNNLFIQFKIPDILKTVGTKEFYSSNAEDLFNAPFFRVKIKNELLQGKPNSGQYEMLQKIARSGKSAQYIFPIFNPEIECDTSHSPDYWFKSFYTGSPNTTLNQYCISVDFADMLTSEFNLLSVNSHTICSDYDTAMNKGEVYVFSKAKYVPAKQFNSFLRFDQDLKNDNEIEKTSEETIQELLGILELKLAENSIFQTVNDLQNYLLSMYNIYWIPIVKKSKK